MNLARLRPRKLSTRVAVLVMTLTMVLAAIGWPELERPTLIVGHQPTLGGIAALVLAGQHSTWSIRRSALWWFKRRQRHGHVETVLRVVLDPELLD